MKYTVLNVKGVVNFIIMMSVNFEYTVINVDGVVNFILMMSINFLEIEVALAVPLVKPVQ